MSNLRTICLGSALLLAGPASAHFATAIAEGFKSSDYESLGKLIAAYGKARVDNKGVDKAQEEIAKELASIQKRIKRDPLASSADMGKALWQQFAYDKSANNAVKHNKVDLRDFTAYFNAKAKLAYAIWTPAKYDPKKAHPLILCITDKGIKPTDYITENWIDPAIRDGALVATVPMPEKEDAWLAVTPGQECGHANLGHTYREITSNYAVDFDRVFLCGQGRGVEAATTFATRYADRFAGLIGRAGDAADVQVENLSNLPSFFAGGGAKATALSEKLDKLGYKNCTLKPEGKEAEIWAWMQEHPRVSNPMEVVL